jgi:hypothetical protein
MKINISSISIFALLVLVNNYCYSQEPFITETRFAGISRNPALIGLQDDEINVSISYHHLINTVLVPYNYLQVQIESRFNKKEFEIVSQLVQLSGMMKQVKTN